MTKFSFRWGIPELDNRDGTFLPGFILKGYTHLKITRDEFLCVVHLSAYHYDSPKGKSNPSLTTIAREMGYAHKNSVWRMIQSLRKKKMLLVEHNEGMTSTYNMRPFALACQKLAQATVTLEGDTPPGDTSVTLEGDTPSHPNVTEEVEKDKESKKKKIGAEKKPRPTRARDMHFENLSDLCGMTPPERDWKRLVETVAGQLRHYAKELRESGATPEQISLFGEWWRMNDWRGQKGQLPTPADVVKSWPIYLNGHTNGNARGELSPPLAALQRRREEVSNGNH